MKRLKTYLERFNRALTRAICRVRGHQPVRLSVGPNWLEACLRCTAKLDEGTDADVEPGPCCAPYVPPVVPS